MMNLQKGEIRVVDGVLGSNMQDAIEGFLFDEIFPWKFKDDLTSAIDEGKKQGRTAGFAHEFFNCESKINSQWFFLVFPILTNALDQIGIKNRPEKLLQARTFKQEPAKARKEYEVLHVDDMKTRPLVSILYYANDSDGDTFFFDQTTKEYPDPAKVIAMAHDQHQKEFSVAKRVSPKKGRCVIFDGSRYHASSSPQNNQRCVINFSYFV
jgi:hypothetical protein